MLLNDGGKFGNTAMNLQRKNSKIYQGQKFRLLFLKTTQKKVKMGWQKQRIYLAK